MTYNIPITNTDLQAYVDGELSAERCKEVEAYLREHPEAAAVVDDYQQLNQYLHEIYDPVLEEPVPATMTVTHARRPRKLLRVAAMFTLFTLGTVTGWQLHLQLTSSGAQPELVSLNLVRPAAVAHLVYVPEVKHPVEVTAAEQQHLVKWLSKRLDSEMKVPDFRQQGYELVGGRLLPSTDGVAAQLMYQHQNGQRITFYKRKGVWQNRATAFRFQQQDGVAILYWIDGPSGFAIVGDLPKQAIVNLSEVAYHQFNSL